MSKKRTVVSKKDWIIIRLLIVALRNKLHNDRDVYMTLIYLSKKYSIDTVGKCADFINAERNRSANP